MSREEQRYKTYGKYYNLNEDAYYELFKEVMAVIKNRKNESHKIPRETWIFYEEHLGSDKEFFSDDHIKNIVSHSLMHYEFDHDFYFDMRMTKHHMGLLTEDDGPFMGPKEYYAKQKKVIEKCVDKYDKEKLVEAMQ